ncbi:MAG: selenocysteine-specific translation elongation factor [Dehalococcoidia bacterium]
MFVLGTAGHVDHGKSTLVQALTGIDPDRLREEKERGMTIDLGFAWLKLPSGREVSIVDVPGHERFIKNMLAGVGGIDLALLVVAADEGVMPQTREHLAILDLLRVSKGLAVIAKSDLVEPDWLELVTADVEEALSETSLAGSSVLPVSAVTGAGLDELRAAIDSQLDAVAVRADRGRPRLPIDRVFTVAGFGTVVTGTLIDGLFEVGQEVEILPGGLRTRIRGLQTHRAKVERAQPGSRVAMNLTGLATSDVRRGEVVTRPGWLRATSAVDVRLRLIDNLERPLRHNTEVTFHAYSSEVNAKVRLLEADTLFPGESAWAQIRTKTPVAVAKGDLFVIRSANETLGGGEVVETAAKRHRRRDERTLDRLAALEHGSGQEVLVQTLGTAEPDEVSALLHRTPLPPTEARAALEAALESGDIRLLGGRSAAPGSYLATASGWAKLVGRVQSALNSYHRQFPLRGGMPREELKQRIGVSGRAWPDVLAELLATKTVTDAGGGVRLPEFSPTLTERQRTAAAAYLEALHAEPFAPSATPPADPELVAYLIEQGAIVRVADNLIFDAGVYRQMVDEVVDRLKSNGKISVAEVRDAFGTSRKFALGLLEYLDDQKVTRRQGDERVLRDGTRLP